MPGIMNKILNKPVPKRFMLSVLCSLIRILSGYGSSRTCQPGGAGLPKIYILWFMGFRKL